MPIAKVSFEESLGKSVLPKLCCGCASCVVVCPFNCLEYVGRKPALVKECKVCGICAQICPKHNLPMPTLEQVVFGRERKKGEEFGVYRDVVIARTTDDHIMEKCQDGGIVTTLLVYALENGMIDGAALSGTDEKEPLRTVPKLATSANEIIGCAGTRYTYSANMLAFREGVLQKKRSLAFVGVPCQIQTLRRIQALPLKKYSDALGFAVGLFCSECFAYKGLVEKLIRGEMGIDPSDVKKVGIKGKILVTMKSGETKTVALKDAKKYAYSFCSSCPDFSAELADISVGGLGLNGWTLTVLRSEKGEELFRKAEKEGLIRARSIEEEKDVLDMLVKFSIRKRENASKPVS